MKEWVTVLVLLLSGCFGGAGPESLNIDVYAVGPAEDEPPLPKELETENPALVRALREAQLTGHSWVKDTEQARQIGQFMGVAFPDQVDEIYAWNGTAFRIATSWDVI